MRDSLLRYLERERLAERRANRELRAKPLAERVESGDAIPGLTMQSQGGGQFVLVVPDNPSRFRDGDALWLSDGNEIERGVPVRLVRYEPATRRIVVERDARDDAPLRLSSPELVLDRRPLEHDDRFRNAIEEVFARTDHPIVECLAGRLASDDDERMRAEMVKTGRARGLDPSQAEAFARALARPRVHLIQGPPGTGKTRLLAELLDTCLAAGERVAVAAYTHRAVDQVLLKTAERAGAARVVKLDRGRTDAAELAAAGVRRASSVDRLLASREPLVVGVTTHAACRLAEKAKLDRVVFDEAGQIPLPHAVAAMRLAPRWVFVGDHAQLPPVVAGVHPEDHTTSAFEHLVKLYPSTMLETTYRMNSGVCAFPSKHFYGGRLHPSPQAAARKLALQPGGRFRNVLDPDVPSVFVEVDHRGAAMRSNREAAIVAELIVELMAHHKIPAEEIAAIAPFRAQVVAIRHEVERRAAARGLKVGAWPFVETVERIQGREREVVLLSFASSDPDWLAGQADFYFLPNRLNVALTRARTKRILVASPLAFAVRPRSLADVPPLAIFAALREATPRIAAESVEREMAAGA